MRRLLLAVLPVMAIVLAGCPKKPEPGECKTSADCADQVGYGKVCVEGRCQECAADGDCQAGFACRDNKCVPRPECATDADCPADQMCQAERCVARPTPPPEPEAPRFSAACSDEAAFTIYFDFDRSVLKPQAQGTLQKLADCAREGISRLVVTGHCDERGTTEYNLALGSRRAEAAKRYLANLGAAATIEINTAGEERPVCNESNEDCWSRNRRAEFQIVR